MDTRFGFLLIVRVHTLTVSIFERWGRHHVQNLEVEKDLG